MSGAMGRSQLTLLRELGLRRDHRVLEIGCGIGRLVYELAGYLTDGRYDGFDVSIEAIEWLNEHYAPRLPGFSFTSIDVQNARYNPEGANVDSGIQFPYRTGSYDVVCAFSVFTHLRPTGMRNYVYEVGRMLKKRGWGVLTFFELTEEDTNPTYLDGRTFQPWAEGGGAWTLDPEVPEKGVAYPSGMLKAALDAAGLVVSERRWGAWRQGPEAPASLHGTVHQDVLVVRRSWKRRYRSARLAL